MSDTEACDARRLRTTRVGVGIGIGVLALALLAVASAADAHSARPSVTAVSPAKGPATGGTEVTVEGRNLTPASGPCMLLAELQAASLPRCAQTIVRFGSEPGLVVSASQERIAVLSPPGRAGAVDVTVSTREGTSAPRRDDRFAYLGASPPLAGGPVPVVSGVSPAQGPASGFTRVLVSGEHLLPGAAGACIACAGVVVRFGGSSVPVIEGTPSELLVASPPHAPGSVALTVAVDGEASTPSSAARFDYLDASRRSAHPRGRHHG